MNLMMVLKTVFFMCVLLFLVLMGLHNQSVVTFNLPPVLHENIQQPAAIMYFGFFGVGVVTGTLAALGQRPKKQNKPS
jgi:uncharacterized integral membrane protein